MGHTPKYCGVCKGRTPFYFCETENRYICNECNHFCHRLAHRWKELKKSVKTKG